MQGYRIAMVTLAMWVLPVVVAGLICRQLRSGTARAGIAAVMAIQIALAALLGQQMLQGRPPLIMPVMALTVACTVVLFRSRAGSELAALPLAWIIGLQCFRLPLELVMHQAAVEGLMPVQMSFSGYNFDIVAGATAIPVTWLAAQGKAPRWLLLGWNLLGTITLAVIVGIAIASLPAFALFGPDRLNTWIASPPYIWLPGVLVQVALLGHLLVWRKLLKG